MGKNNRPLVNNRPIGIRVPEALHAVLSKAAQDEQRTLSNYVVRVLTAHAAELQTKEAALKGKKGGK